MDFTKLVEKRIDPPFVPSLSKGYQDISMFEDATAVDIHLSRPTPSSRHQKDPGSPDITQIQGFNFQAKTSQILTESAKKTRPFVDDSSRPPRVPSSELPVFSNMRRSKSSESLDTAAAKHAVAGSPSIEPIQAPLLLVPVAAELEKAQSSPTIPNPGKLSPSPPADPAAVATASAPPPAPPKPSPVELAAQFFASCGWDSKAAAALLIEALADPSNPQLSDKKFQHAAALFSNEITSAIL
jgi:hypothetical protein